MGSGDPRKRVGFVIFGAGVLLGTAVAALGFVTTLSNPGVLPLLAAFLGVSTALLSGVTLGRLAYMDRRAARIRRRWSSRSRGTR